MLSTREIEKLKAIGYELVEGTGPMETAGWLVKFGRKKPFGWTQGRHNMNLTWVHAKAHAQSPEGLKATMADKVRWLGVVRLMPPANGYRWTADTDLTDAHESAAADGDSPEAAVDALFWKVP